MYMMEYRKESAVLPQDTGMEKPAKSTYCVFSEREKNGGMEGMAMDRRSWLLGCIGLLIGRRPLPAPPATLIRFSFELSEEAYRELKMYEKICTKHGIVRLFLCKDNRLSVFLNGKTVPLEEAARYC